MNVSLFLVENYCLTKQMSLKIFTEQVIFTYHNIYGEYITNYLFLELSGCDRSIHET
jgi:hypothetical protein